MLETEIDPVSKPPILDLLAEDNQFSFKDTVRIDPNQLAKGKWTEMLEKTESTGLEYGVVISQAGRVSDIFEGEPERKDPYSNKVVPASITPPILAYGLRGIFQKPGIFIHTHPKPPKIDDLPTTVFSDSDIAGFKKKTYLAVVVLDTGGIHVLTGWHQDYNSDNINPKNIVDKAFSITQQETGLIKQIRQNIAEALSSFGIKYYFTPDFELDPDGYLTLKNAAS